MGSDSIEESTSLTPLILLVRMNTCQIQLTTSASERSCWLGCRSGYLLAGGGEQSFGGVASRLSPTVASTTGGSNGVQAQRW